MRRPGSQWRFLSLPIFNIMWQGGTFRAHNLFLYEPIFRSSLDFGRDRSARVRVRLESETQGMLAGDREKSTGIVPTVDEPIYEPLGRPGRILRRRKDHYVWIVSPHDHIPLNP